MAFKPKILLDKLNNTAVGQNLYEQPDAGQSSPFAEAVSPSSPLVIADSLGIKYEGEKEKSGDFKSLTHNLLSFRRSEKFEDIWALRSVSFQGYPGDVLGIIGFNGAGKTTLCQALLGMMKPDKGSLEVHGKVSSLLSLGTGFNKNISGRENIILNGLVLGLSRRKLESLLPKIEEFSGLGRFLDHPLKYYSDGMKSRLGFSIAVAIEPEILVLDEVFSTGDLEFKERAVRRMHEMVSGAKMVIVVTQDPDFIEENCNRGIWLHEGKVASLGHATAVAEDYRQAVASKTKSKKKIISVPETHAQPGEEETIKVENLGIKFNLEGETHWALKDVSFTVHEKEILGIIGHNGAGKSTLCRTLSGLYRPDTGNVQVRGEITPLLTFNLGFNSQLSGYDNIYLNGMMLGIPKEEIRKLEDRIISFAELEKKIHKPVKEYSSGMKSRLGFSIAAMLKPDVFIVDEALSAGDMAFKEKATLRMQEMMEEAKTVVLVTHSLKIVEKVCTRAIWLQNGSLKFNGPPGEAVQRYKESIEKYRKMKKKLPVKEDARLAQAVEHFQAGEFRLAETLLEEVLHDSPHDLPVLIQYADIPYALKNWEEAKRRWEKVVEVAEEIGEPVPQKAEKRLKKLERKVSA